MAGGSLAVGVACLLLGQVGGSEGTPWYVRTRELSIPIKLSEAARSEARDFLLFASWDRGQNYQLVDRVAPEKNEFSFRATNDGVCWLKVALVNRQGKQIPDNIQEGPPHQRIIIDTVKPVISKFNAQRLGDEVAVAWEILEDYFDPQGFQLEYRPKDSPSSFWAKIDAPAALAGQTRLRPSSAGPLELRMTAKDFAGNQSMMPAEVAGTVTAASYSPPTTPAPPQNSAAPALPPPLPPPASNSAPLFSPPPVVEPVKQPAPPSNTWSPNANVPPHALEEPKDRLVASSDAPPPKPALPKPASPPAPSVPASAPLPPAPPKPALPNLRYVNHPEVLLEYELARVGKSGVGSVDLWITRNDGANWDRYAYDPGVKGAIPNGKQQLTVELPGEGIYGLTLVVKSKAGLGKAPPQPGEVPEIRVEVDTTPPLAQLFAPVPDVQQPGALLLKWKATDRNDNLTNNPITLEWAKNREGPWNIINADMPNTGMHSWRLPDDLPVQVFMRLRVKDLAGNESIAVTPDPQLVDLSEPEGRLLDVSVAPRK